MSTLTIHVDRSISNYPKVILLIDGVERLTSTGDDEASDPADILDTGALLPTDPPRRVAFYGCGCGTFGCSNVTGLVVQSGDLVRWTDFLSLTGAYASALPDPEDGPDPAIGFDTDLPPKRHALPTFTFDREQYLNAVRAAMADRSWETRPRAVVRHLRALQPGTHPWATLTGESITVHHTVDGMAWSTDLPLPPGRPSQLAESLAALLDQGLDPRRIAAERLWR
ncbi:hypothetical protein [Nocardioides sp. SYSU D00038]|uniref:hypothetical protein n=1 Tax=Nocardioides sp. SYSU D00038 TaxID=2812554 RepID=UPI00196788C5|nr:hypothetical protein [Nocardioides sp. SYSU D00038]